MSLVACSYFHSIVVCADGAVFGAGRNDCGQLGHGDTLERRRLTQLPRFPSPESPSGAGGGAAAYDAGGCAGCGGGAGGIVAVACGQFHSAFVTRDGRLLTCGKNEHGQLGHETPGHRRTPTRVGGGGLAGRFVISVTA